MPNTSSNLTLVFKIVWLYDKSFLPEINLDNALGTPEPAKSSKMQYTGKTIWYKPNPTPPNAFVKGTRYIAPISFAKKVEIAKTDAPLIKELFFICKKPRNLLGLTIYSNCLDKMVATS